MIENYQGLIDKVINKAEDSFDAQRQRLRMLIDRDKELIKSMSNREVNQKKNLKLMLTKIEERLRQLEEDEIRIIRLLNKIKEEVKVVDDAKTSDKELAVSAPEEKRT